jgi:ribokinase
MEKPIVVVGSINLDLVAVADRIPRVGETVIGSSFQTFFGGKGANQAVAAVRLGFPVVMVGNVGNDAFGLQLRQGLDDAGIDTSCVNVVDESSGVALVTTGSRGENNIVVVPGANGHLTPEMLERAGPALQRAGFLLAQLEIPLETVEYVAMFAERHGIPLMLDPAPARELPADLLRRVTWLTPNESETNTLLQIDMEEEGALAAADQLLHRGAQNVLLKLGSRGCMIAQRNLTKQYLSAFAVDTVDTTAAGDAFNAGFAVGLLRGKTPVDSAVFASAVAAISVSRRGAQPSMPSGDEVEKFLQERQTAQPVQIG